MDNRSKPNLLTLAAVGFATVIIASTSAGGESPSAVTNAPAHLQGSTTTLGMPLNECVAMALR